MDLLGNHFDIHCGGVDNIFPHHENEIAQSCASTNSEFVNVWLHNKHLLVDGEKMSKSLGNFYKIPELIEKGYSAEAIRYTLISTHYRQELNFTFEKLNVSQKAINRLRELQRRLQCVAENSRGNIDARCEKMVEEFQQTLGEDLNISGALGVLFIWVNEVFGLLDKNEISKDSAECALETLCNIDVVLGVIECPAEKIDCDIDELIQQRITARENKDWLKADEIRTQLDDLGVILEDTSDGTIWKRK